MRSKTFSMNPEDLEKYGGNIADEKLRRALKQATERLDRALYALTTGIRIKPLI